MSLFGTVQSSLTSAVPHLHATATSPGSQTGLQSSSAMVSANAFLQLLVTELKNQDPTANQDPNAYVDQLVQVNSLQQLIQINQTLDGATAGSPQGVSATPSSGS